MKHLVLIILVYVLSGNCIYLNKTDEKSANNPAISMESEIWGPLLEEWTLGTKNNREQRVMKISQTDNNFVITNRKDVHPPAKVINNVPSSSTFSGGGTIRPMQEKPPVRQITETDLYLLGAIEKLVYRADFMEKRLRRVEEMLYYVMAGNRMDHEPCPENFTRAGTQCYLFTESAGREKDWKSANRLCRKQGAVLAEMETIEENQDVVAYIQTNSQLKGKDFWTGGLNPGLLWIWSNSARPVSADKHQKPNSTANIHGDGRCLRLAYDPAYRNYAYRGTDCSARYQYICELPDKTTSNELNRLAKERNLDLL